MPDRATALSALLAAALAVVAPATAPADVVLDWNEVVLDAIRTDRTPPPRATRALAMTHVAVFEAVNAVLGGYGTYHEVGDAPDGASPEAAAAAAAHRVLGALYPAQQASFDAALAASLAAIPDGPAETTGREWGVTCADAILELRRADHSADLVDSYAPPGAGWWAPTPPGFAPALLPNWPRVTPWALRHLAALRAPAPPGPNNDEYTAAFREVKRLGGKTSTARTADQAEIARFWDDGPGSATPPGHWNAIAQSLAEQHHLSLLDNARLFALLGMTVADAAIVAWDTKYHYQHWRPVTGIRAADADGNPHTVQDASWESLIGTPPFPAYTSGHSTFSGSSARLLELFFGTDALPFSVGSDLLPGVTRDFATLSEAAEEAGQSRIYGGIHWQYDNQYGLKAGRAIAEEVFFTQLRPVATAETCHDGPETLCLVGGRFRVTASWRTAAAAGAGQAKELEASSGAFWFFAADNTELVVKVLDGCDYNDRYWVFASGLTDVQVEVTVTDTHTGKVRSYFNPRGRAFAPVQDVEAFATCD